MSSHGSSSTSASSLYSNEPHGNSFGIRAQWARLHQLLSVGSYLLLLCPENRRSAVELAATLSSDVHCFADPLLLALIWELDSLLPILFEEFEWNVSKIWSLEPSLAKVNALTFQLAELQSRWCQSQEECVSHRERCVRACERVDISRTVLRLLNQRQQSGDPVPVQDFSHAESSLATSQQSLRRFTIEAKEQFNVVHEYSRRLANLKKQRVMLDVDVFLHSALVTRNLVLDENLRSLVTRIGLYFNF